MFWEFRWWAQFWQKNTFFKQVELSQEMINLKQAEAEKRRSAVIIFLKNWRNEMLNTTNLAMWTISILSVYVFFQFINQRAKSARASSAARMRSTPSAGRVYTVTFLFHLFDAGPTVASIQCRRYINSESIFVVSISTYSIGLFADLWIIKYFNLCVSFTLLSRYLIKIPLMHEPTFAGTYWVSNWGPCWKLFRGDPCHLRRVR